MPYMLLVQRASPAKHVPVRSPYQQKQGPRSISGADIVMKMILLRLLPADYSTSTSVISHVFRAAGSGRYDQADSMNSALPSAPSVFQPSSRNVIDRTNQTSVHARSERGEKREENRTTPVVDFEMISASQKRSRLLRRKMVIIGQVAVQSAHT